VSGLTTASEDNLRQRIVVSSVRISDGMYSMDGMYGMYGMYGVMVNGLIKRSILLRLSDINTVVVVKRSPDLLSYHFS
jgi:hypothetical protein